MNCDDALFISPFVLQFTNSSTDNFAVTVDRNFVNLAGNAVDILDIRGNRTCFKRLLGSQRKHILAKKKEVATPCNQ